eukprot:CAMPEP_0195532586 /NCGR_PEP_ID=MMETSP0794_2-20130614/38559_1 /TAXON_ID=515487 /ORGANISM="Stephanopyxis turris, Strain CCMP 815" /LENGTH=309 /DNA_ID=CAMNT_0040664861 /DNA_START=79 /DNA_END=1005 /DNA_ORIENTATION=+
MARGRTSRRKAGRNASVPVSVTSASSSHGDSGNGNNAEDGAAEDIVAVTATATATLAATESSPNSTARVVVSVQSSDVGKDDDGSAEASSTGEKRSKRSRAARGRRDASTARKTIDVTPAAKKTKKMSRSSSSRWEAKFELLKQYIEKFGDARVPSALHSEEFPRLGSWVATQRTAYRHEQARARGEDTNSTNHISPEQIAKLESVGFVWGGQLREETWNKHFEQLKEYVKEHGNALVPINAPGGLGFWVHRQRRSYRTENLRAAGKLKKSQRDCLTEDQIQRLKDVGFVWDVAAEQWNAKFNMLREFS